MLRFIVRRTLWLFLVLFVVLLITFVLMHLVPGGPWDREKALAPKVVEALNKRYGLDKPLWEQFVNYIWGVLHGDLGVSYSYSDRTITSILAHGIPKTATLGILAFIFALIVGVPSGVAAALKQNSAIDYSSVLFATIFASVPGFVLGILLMMIFSVVLHWLPTTGWGTFQQLLMPVFCLAALPAAQFARITRASTLEVIRQDYVRTARSKGLPESTIRVRHIFRNSLIPVITVAGPELANLITGSFIIENLFAIPGVGRLFVQGIFARDYTLIMGGILFYAIVIAILNLLVDILYAAIDPRIRYE
ncbi:MAG: ABC transporter permease [Dehalococcoidales bacterium]|nr:ABC transporter permease [Dehalococcoidales bacterium]